MLGREVVLRSALYISRLFRLSYQVSAPEISCTVWKVTRRRSCSLRTFWLVQAIMVEGNCLRNVAHGCNAHVQPKMQFHQSMSCDGGGKSASLLFGIVVVLCLSKLQRPVSILQQRQEGRIEHWYHLESRSLAVWSGVRGPRRRTVESTLPETNMITNKSEHHIVNTINQRHYRVVNALYIELQTRTNMTHFLNRSTSCVGDLKQVMICNRGPITQDSIQNLPQHNRVLHSYNPSVVFHKGMWYALLQISNHDNCHQQSTPLPNAYINYFSIRQWGNGTIREEVLWTLPDISGCRLLPSSDQLRILCDPAVMFSLSVSGEGFVVRQIHGGTRLNGKNINAFEVRPGVWLWFLWPIRPPDGQRTVLLQHGSGSTTKIRAQVLAKSRVPVSWEPRGSACCVSTKLKSNKHVLVGIGHYKVYKRNRRYYNYLSFAYAMDTRKYDIVAISLPFCFALPNLVHFDGPPIPECPSSSLVYSMNNFNETHIIIGVGSNDCNAYLVYVPRSSVINWFA